MMDCVLHRGCNLQENRDCDPLFLLSVGMDLIRDSRSRDCVFVVSIGLSYREASDAMGIQRDRIGTDACWPLMTNDFAMVRAGKS